MPPLRSRPPGPRRGAGGPARGRPPPRPGAARAAADGVQTVTLTAASDANRKAMAAGLVGLLFISLGAILFVMFQLIMGDPQVPVPVARKPFVIPASALQFGTLADFERANLRSGQLFAISISEPELNARLADIITKQPDLPFRGVTAKVLTDSADFNGSVRAAGLELSPTINMSFRAEGGRLRHSIDSIHFGPIPVPGFARSAVSDTVDRQLDGQQVSDKYTIEDIQLNPGVVNLVGRMR